MFAQRYSTPRILDFDGLAAGSSTNHSDASNVLAAALR